MSEWTSVKDKLPEVDDYVLWYYENGLVVMDCIDKDWDMMVLKHFLSGNKAIGPVKYWMRVPAIPSE